MESVVSQVRAAVRSYGHPLLELEYRLGKQVGQKFIPGVSRESFKKIQHALEYCVEATPLAPQKTTEAITANGVKHIVERDEWIHKVRLGNVDLGRIEPSAPYVARASISIETPVQAPSPAAAQSDPVVCRRKKDRKSFQYKCWRYDLTSVANGEQDADDDVYEVEVELAHTDALFVYTVEHLVNWGAALISDCARLGLDH